MPLDGSGTFIGAGDVEMQAGQCVANLLTLVGVHGFGREDIHHLTVHVVGPHQNPVNAWIAITRCFEADVPPATLLGASCLGYQEQLVEIDAHVERRA